MSFPQRFDIYQTRYEVAEHASPIKRHNLGITVTRCSRLGLLEHGNRGRTDSIYTPSEADQPLSMTHFQ